MAAAEGALPRLTVHFKGIIFFRQGPGLNRVDSEVRQTEDTCAFQDPAMAQGLGLWHHIKFVTQLREPWARDKAMATDGLRVGPQEGSKRGTQRPREPEK